MSVKFETLQVGDLLYDVHKFTMGNTTMRDTGVWRVRILELLPNGARVSWNGNQPTDWLASQFRRPNIRRLPPEWIYHPFDGSRCPLCRAKQGDGHKANCAYPESKRKKVSQ